MELDKHTHSMKRNVSCKERWGFMDLQIHSIQIGQ